MVKILLMAMPDIHPSYHSWKGLTPSLALSSIAANLDKRHTVTIADLVLKRKDVKQAVLEALEKSDPEVVGLSTMTFQYDTAVKIARFVKQINPQIKTVLGGYHATVGWEEITGGPDARHFDFVVRGEGDILFNELIDSLEGGRDIASIGGLSHKKDGVFVHNGPRPLEDVNRIRLPYRGKRLWGGYHTWGLPLDLIESSRGCVLPCSFCSITRMYGRTFRRRDVSLVLQDIANAKKAGAKTLFFVDDNITLDLKRLEKLTEEIIAQGHDDMIYYVQATSAAIAKSPELVKKMARAGFTIVFLGIENILDTNLTLLKKGDIAVKSRKAIELLHESGISVVGGLILGNPDDDAGRIEANYQFAHEMKIDFFYDQIITPYLKTEMREELLREGLVTNKWNYRFYSGHFANVKSKHLSDMELNFIKYKMVRKYAPKGLKAIAGGYKLLLRSLPRFLPKLIPLLFREMLLTYPKQFFMNEEERFLEDHKNCLKLNDFNLPEGGIPFVENLPQPDAPLYREAVAG